MSTPPVETDFVEEDKEEPTKQMTAAQTDISQADEKSLHELSSQLSPTPVGGRASLDRFLAQHDPSQRHLDSPAPIRQHVDVVEIEPTQPPAEDSTRVSTSHEKKSIVPVTSEADVKDEYQILSKAEWRPQTLSDPKSSRIAIHHRHGNCIAPLLCHYPWIVYIVYCLWRKMIYMIPGSKFDQIPSDELPSLGCPLSHTSNQLAAAQMIQRGVAKFYGETFPATGEKLRDSSLFCSFYAKCSYLKWKDAIALMMTGLKLDKLDCRVEQVALGRGDPKVCLLYGYILAHRFKNPNATSETKRETIVTFGEMASWSTAREFIPDMALGLVVDHMKTENLPLEDLSQCVDFFARFTKVKPYFDVALYTDYGVLPELAKLLNHYDEDIVRQATLSLSYISDGDTRILQVATPELIKRAAALVAHKSEEVMIAGLRLLGNFCSADDDIAAAVLETGWHTQVPKLLQCASSLVRKETCWMLSNIAAGPDDQVDWLVKSGYMPLCVPALSQELTVQKEALWIFKNVADIITKETKAHMTHLMDDCQFLQPFTDILDTRDRRLVRPVLDSLESLITLNEKWRRGKEAEEQEEGGSVGGDVYPFISMLIGYALPAKLMLLTGHPAEVVATEAEQLEEHLLEFEEWIEVRKS